MGDTKSISVFYCENCDYSTAVFSNYKKHLSTYKHQKVSKVSEKYQEQDDKKFQCPSCFKLFKCRNGLWKHKKANVCGLCPQKNQTVVSSSSSPSQNNTELSLETILQKDKIIASLVEQLKTNNSGLLAQNSELMDIIKTSMNTTTSSYVVNNIHNTQINKTFNLQVFLNETCKDAMNITEFIDTIEPQLTDLEEMGEIGYVTGISNIITKHLNALEVTRRPIHCTDKKREILYIKDGGEWKKEDEEKTHIKKMITRAEYKSQKLLPLFKQKYPKYRDANSPHSDLFNKTIVEAMGGAGNNDLEKANKIIKNITKHVSIGKGYNSNGQPNITMTLTQ